MQAYATYVVFYLGLGLLTQGMLIPLVIRFCNWADARYLAPRRTPDPETGEPEVRSADYATGAGGVAFTVCFWPLFVVLLMAVLFALVAEYVVLLREARRARRARRNG